MTALVRAQDPVQGAERLAGDVSQGRGWDWRAAPGRCGRWAPEGQPSGWVH